jgi:hypothetical protein
MRTVTWIRNYCLVVFFVIMTGGVVLQPGQPAPTASNAPGPAATAPVPADPASALG